MPVSLYASEPHYLRTMLPVWWALEADERATVYLAGVLADSAVDEGLGPVTFGHPSPGDEPVMVASHKDYLPCAAAGRPVVFHEHGAGQRYLGDGAPPDPSYAGSPDHDACVLFLCPREEVCDWWAERYPDVPAVAVGCPRLDPWHAGLVGRNPEPSTVAFTFHADSRLNVFSASGFQHYEALLPSAVRALASEGITVLGHGHPRIFRQLARRWEAMGVEPVADFDEIANRAGLLAAENTSALPEFASLGRPVLWLNLSWWPRTVAHGGRFWDWPAGQVQCDEPGDLAAKVLVALADPLEVAEARRRMVESVYAACDGHAAERAAEAIRRYVP